MPTITKQVLQLSKLSPYRPTATVTVSGTINFDASDVGRTYQLEIKLCGEDRPTDDLPASDRVGDDLLYNFLWPPVPARIPAVRALAPRGRSTTRPRRPLFSPFPNITVKAPGSQSFEETRTVNLTALDEGTGTVDSGRDPEVPHEDEVYAVIRLSSTVSTMAKTSTVLVQPDVLTA